MSKHKIKLLFFAFILVVMLQEGDSLKCWRCSTDAPNAAFCDDPFDPSLITEQQRLWTYVDCSFAPSQLNPYSTPQSGPVCKKQIQLINGNEVIYRSCSWENIYTASDNCMKILTPSYVKTLFCKTCRTDGCNGAELNRPISDEVSLLANITNVLRLQNYIFLID